MNQAFENFAKYLKSATDFLLGLAVGMVVVGVLISLLSGCTPAQAPAEEPVAAAPTLDCKVALDTWVAEQEANEVVVAKASSQFGPYACGQVEEIIVCRLVVWEPTAVPYILKTSGGSVISECEYQGTRGTLIGATIIQGNEAK